MAKSEYVYKVFISSPSDLKEERQSLKKAIEELDIPDCRLQAVLWEDDVASCTTDDAQGEINVLLGDCDILCGVFKSRFGSPTNRSDSGTVEEIELQISRKKPVMLYFLQYTFDTNGKKAEDLQEVVKILDFKKKYEKKGIYHECDSIDSVIRKHLKNDIAANIKRIPVDPLEMEEDAKPAGEDAKSAGEDAKSAGEDAKPAGEDAKSAGEDVVPRSAKSYDSQDKPWYMDRIATLINDHLRRKYFGYTYKEDLTFQENLLLSRNSGTVSFMASSAKNIMEGARMEAFNIKYGTYDYQQDVRMKYPGWGANITKIIKEIFPTRKKLKILDVGGNYGIELEELFGKIPLATHDCTIVDISTEAIHRGLKTYPKIKFVQADMESDYLQSAEDFDVCMCLRAIQSRGVYRNAALIQMSKHLRSGGIIFISIPNGYIDGNGKVVKGLYDHRTKTFLKDRPISLASKIFIKLGDYNFVNAKILFLDTEILIYAQKE